MRPPADFDAYKFGLCPGSVTQFGRNYVSDDGEFIQIVFTRVDRTEPCLVLILNGVPVVTTKYSCERHEYETTWLGYLSGPYGEDLIRAYCRLAVIFGEDSQEVYDYVVKGEVPGDVRRELVELLADVDMSSMRSRFDSVGEVMYAYSGDGHDTCEFEGRLASILYEHHPDGKNLSEPTGW